MKEYTKGSEWRKWDLHLHTASSYDYEYHGEDADDILVKSLTDNEIAAVAITDHFIVDKVRIENLRSKAPNITFFPGVELRTDKGATNIHIILIFSEKIDLKALFEDFNSFKRNHAINPNDDDRIFWSFEDIFKFAQAHHALISIHAGSKTSGIDDRIKVDSSVADAIKDHYSENVDFFEIGKVKDVDIFKTRVFPSIGIHPLLLCSDNHDARNYMTKDNLWIKADPTFEGLIQTTFIPEERIFIGNIPPGLDKTQKNKKNYIDSIKVNRINNPKNTLFSWFEFELPINAGLTTIIGNKGSGKSALSDIIGHFAKSQSMQKASFLNVDRFRKSPRNYAFDYQGNLTWCDGHIDDTMNLGLNVYNTSIENAQYLPQKYIEEVCNDLGDQFKDEINKVIFSYVDSTEKGDATYLEELVNIRSSGILSIIEKSQFDLSKVNQEIIALEDKLTKNYLKQQNDNLKKCMETLQRYESNKPKEIEKPKTDHDEKYETALQELNNSISVIEVELEEKKTQLTKTNNQINTIDTTVMKLDETAKEIEELNMKLSAAAIQLELTDLKISVDFDTPKQVLVLKKAVLISERDALKKELDTTDNTEESASLVLKLSNAKAQKSELVSKTDSQEKAYQKYQEDLKEWEEKRKALLGDKSTIDTVLYYQNEVEYITTILQDDYNEKKANRNKIVREIFEQKQKIASIYSDIYKPVDTDLQILLSDLEDKIEFAVELSLKDIEIEESLLQQINQSFAGVFNGKTIAMNNMNKFIKQTDFNDYDSVKTFINNVMQVITENIDDSTKKVKNKFAFYDMLFGLEYMGAQYNLKMGGRYLNELSPGERGIVLLIFYLALSKNDIPIIIDQPEDNLDNQSVYSKLVKCILAAKKKRQVIIVTHNPNIAIACDAEEIVYCSIDKTNNKICYCSGGIENGNMRNKVIDVLEGTKPAFDLRKRKYSIQ